MKAIWLALSFVLILEGIGPMLFPHQWRKFLKSVSDSSENSMRRLGGCLVVIGAVAAYAICTLS